MNVEENQKTVNQDLQTLTLIYIFKTLILFQKAKVCIMLPTFGGILFKRPKHTIFWLCRVPEYN